MKIRNKRTVEIYFVLYLAAIVFLLPDKNDEENANASGSPIAPGAFSLSPTKTSLNFRFYEDSSGVKVIDYDSVNTILLGGNVKNADFEIEVEDKDLRQKQKIKPGSKYFAFEENIQKKELKFSWNPPLFDKKDKTYIVRVFASAERKDADSEDDESPDNGAKLQAETQFSLIINNVSDELVASGESITRNREEAASRADSIRYVEAEFRRPRRSGEVDLSPEEAEVKAIAYQKWRNKVYVFNANPERDLARKPQITVEQNPEGNQGDAQLDKIGKNHILISGKTPAYGSMKVEVRTKFNYDDKERSVDFTVLPEPILKPEYERVIYPEKSYLIKPNLPYLRNQELKAYLANDGEVLVKSPQGEAITFEPSLNLVGEVLKLKRYVNDNLLDQYDIRVLDYPNPIIYDIQEAPEGWLKIITHSYGYYNGKRNYVELNVEGNAETRELRGPEIDAPDEITIVQIFKCTPENPDKPFIFEVQAIDERGRKSKTKKYSAEN